MKRGLLFLGLWVGLCARGESPQAFLENYQAQLPQKAWLDAPKLGESARRYHFLFVTGFQGDTLLRGQGYFHYLKSALRELGVPAGQMQVVRTSSFRKVETGGTQDAKWSLDNTDLLANGLFRWARRAPSHQKVVILGHSMGAVAALALALKNPELVDQWVEKIYAVQGPISGNEVSSLAAGESFASFERVRPATRGLLQMQLFVLDWVLHFRRANHSMAVGVSEDRLERLWENSQQREGAMTKQVLEKHLLFVRSRMRGGKGSWMTDAAAAFLNEAFPSEAHDGLISTARQSWKPQGVETQTVTLPGVHHLFPLGPASWCPQLIAQNGLRERQNRALLAAILRDLP